jgi:hypothetical protein
LEQCARNACPWQAWDTCLLASTLDVKMVPPHIMALRRSRRETSQNFILLRSKWLRSETQQHRRNELRLCPKVYVSVFPKQGLKSIRQPSRMADECLLAIATISTLGTASLGISVEGNGAVKITTIRQGGPTTGLVTAGYAVRTVRVVLTKSTHRRGFHTTFCGKGL